MDFPTTSAATTTAGGSEDNKESAAGDPYWWNQSSSTSRNLLDSVGEDLWDGLFQEKADSFTLQQWENKLCLNEKSGKRQKATTPTATLAVKSPTNSSPQSESVSVSTASIPVHKDGGTSAGNNRREDKPSSSSRITENSSTRESNNSNGSQALSDITIHLDYARLKTEHRKLKKYFESACESRHKTPPVRETVRRLNRAEPVALDLYKLHSEKLELLNAALEECDWDGIITVVLFIKRTLSNPLFRQCLIAHPKAACHYITYLRECGDTVELTDTLFGLGQTSEAAMVEFVSACKWTDPQRKLEALRNCLLSGFSHPQLANERRSLQEWIKLLEAHLKRP